MNREHYIAGDWGTSRLRLALCRGEHVLETRQGPGIGALRSRPTRPCGGVGAANLAPWRQAGCTGVGVGGDLYRAGHPAGEVHRRALALVAAWRAPQ